MKVAPLLRELKRRGAQPAFVHTGQHYDELMSKTIFTDLGLAEPSANLDVRSGSHAVQSARVLERFDQWLDENLTDMVVVVGDVNSSMACALAAAKRGLTVAHVEAGLRSRDRTMPEEINRLVIDALARWLLTPSADADENLRLEGVHADRIRCVGNIMADSLFGAIERASESDVLRRCGMTDRYGLVTLHRPALVDDDVRFSSVLSALEELADSLELLWPVHPRARAWIDALERPISPRIRLVPPLSYLDFVWAEAKASLVLTDSGGVQEETTMLGIPCLTLRENTERPITITNGTNVLVGFDRKQILGEASRALAFSGSKLRPELWDGHAAERIADVLLGPDALSPVP